MRNPFADSLTLAVVDASPADYQRLLNLAESAGLNVCLFSSGAAALDFARQTPVALWIVNTRLTDCDGFALAERLVRRGRHTPIFMVDDAYDVDAEMETLSRGLSKYLCKPVDPCWIVESGLLSLAPAAARRQAAAASALAAEAPDVLPLRRPQRPAA